MEQIETIFTQDDGFTITMSSMGLTVEFEDDGIMHGFTIAFDKLNDPRSWEEATKALNVWLDPLVEPGDALALDAVID